MDRERVGAVAVLWEAHLGGAFPGRLRGADVAGVDMVLLDTDVAGCVGTWLHDGGAIDDGRRDILLGCERELQRVGRELSGYEAAYYGRLLAMTALILGTPGD